MPLAGRLRPRGFYDAFTLAWRRCAGHQALQLFTAARRTNGRVGRADQQLDILVALRAMETIKRHNPRLPFGCSFGNSSTAGRAGTGPSPDHFAMDPKRRALYRT